MSSAIARREVSGGRRRAKTPRHSLAHFARRPGQPRQGARPTRDASTNAVVGESALVVGAGPAGLATAISLAKQGWGEIKVVEKLPPPPSAGDPIYTEAPDRSYNLGVSGRGQKFLDAIGVLDDVREFSCLNFGRMVWDSEGKETITLRPEIAEEKYQAFCIQRDRLTAVLLENARRYDAIEIEHNVDVDSISWDEDGPHVVLGSTEVRPSLLVGADGYRSVVTRALEDCKASDLEMITWEDKNTRVYKTLPLDYDIGPDPGKWKRDLNLSANAQSGADITIEVLPTAEGKGVGVALYKPGNAAIEEASTGEKAKEMIAKNFPQFASVIPPKAFDDFAAQRDQRLPVFQYAKNALHGPRTACVGDAIHTVKPYFGLGVNAAFEDVGVLQTCLETHNDVGKALQQYTDSHKRNVETLVKMSRTFDGGFLSFILPIILDTLFHKILPSVFSTNCIRMLQKHELPFAQAGAIKRKDRALQVSILALVVLPALAVLIRGLKWLMTG